MTVKARAYTITINNDKFSDLKGLIDLTYEYLVIGFEVGEKGTRHIQGYIYFTNARHFTKVKKDIPRAHLEIAKGTPEQNFDYCKKDAEYYEFGVKPSQGRATFDKIAEAMKDPINNYQVYHQYRKSYMELMDSQKKDHSTLLLVERDCQKFNVVRQIKDNYTISIYPSEYDGEDVRIEPAYARSSDEIISLMEGFPPKYRLGYQIKQFHPMGLILTYTDDKELNYIKKMYDQYIDIGCPQSHLNALIPDPTDIEDQNE